MSEPAAIRARGVSKTYGSGESANPVLVDVNLRVERGEILSLMGKSGSGKTTLVNVLSGIESPDHGSVEIEGKDITGFSEEERTRLRRRSMGLVFQFFNLVPTLTVLENVEFPLLMNDREPGDRPRELLEELGLGGQLHQFPATLSGGEQQRVAIVRALVHDPSLVFADEPTGNLDYDHSQRVMDEFQRRCRERDVTVLIATHSEETASVADRRIEIRDGMLRSRVS